MSASQASEKGADKKPKPKKTEIKVNRKHVTIEADHATGMQIKEAAIAQGVTIETDFILTLEPFKGQGARTIADDFDLDLENGMEFSANDGDDDS